MEIRGDLITDFLDLPPHERREGLYLFEPEYSSYFSDIPDDTYFWKIRREAIDDHYGIIDIYLSDIPVSEVFSTARASTPTYVNRNIKESVTYEASILNALKEPGRTLILYGPSKLGKSALWQYVIGTDCISLSCTPDSFLSQLYKQVLYELKNPYASNILKYSAKKSEHKDSVSVSLGQKYLGQFKLGKEDIEKHERALTEDLKYTDRPVSAASAADELSKENLVLIFENYHRLNKKELEKLSYDIRTFADYNVTTVLIGIPEEPYKIIEFNPELMGRTSFLKFNFWEPDELKKIAAGGAQALNIGFSESALDFLANESAGSPLLMQLYSFIACLSSGVPHNQEQYKIIELDKNDFMLAINSWGIESLSPCELICEKLKNTSASIRSLPDDFVEILYQHIRDNYPTLSFYCNEFSCWPMTTRAINALMSRLNKDELTRDLLTFNLRKNELNIGNPFFVSYVRWIKKKSDK